MFRIKATYDVHNATSTAKRIFLFAFVTIIKLNLPVRRRMFSQTETFPVRYYIIIGVWTLEFVDFC